jgi:peptide/nickel transport system substrate-binding protein
MAGMHGKGPAIPDTEGRMTTRRVHRLRTRALARILAVSTILALTAGLPPAGPRAADAQEGVRRGGTLIAILDADPPTLNSIVSNANQVFFASKPIFDTLVEYDAEFNARPHLARAWKVSPDARRYEFELVPNAKWHDGKPVTSDDVKFTLEYALKNSSFVKSVFGTLDTITTPDPHRVVLTFSKPAATAIALLGDPVLNIMPRHVYDTPGDPRQHPANLKPVGSGPFRFKEWVRGDHLTLERNPDYWRAGQPYLDQVIFRIVPNPSVAMATLESGEAAYFPQQVQAVDAVRLRGSNTVKIDFRSIAHSTIVAALNLRKPPLDRPEVRNALALAADRERMVQQVGLGLGRVASGVVASNSWYHDTSLKPLPRDVARANRMLDEAGLKRGADGKRFKVRLLHVASFVPFARTAQILKENWDEVGVDTEIVGGELSTTLQAVFRDWNFDAAVYSVFMGPEVDRRANQFFGTASINKAFFSNAMGYSNPQVDGLIQEASTVVDRKRRTELYARIQRLILADMPVVPLWEDQQLSAYRTDVEGLFPYPDARFVTFREAWRRKP